MSLFNTAQHPPWRHWYNDVIPPHTKPQDRRKAREEREAERERYKLECFAVIHVSLRCVLNPVTVYMFFFNLVFSTRKEICFVGVVCLFLFFC